METEFILFNRKSDGRLECATCCPECGGHLTVRDHPDYLAVECDAFSSLHTGGTMFFGPHPETL